MSRSILEHTKPGATYLGNLGRLGRDEGKEEGAPCRANWR